ncbi:MAG: hypothetical protein Q4F21_13685 [Lachnospiraceae bacterium]|nr:hypothetical protein [Lachnospiraceae bacterium]
MNKKFENYDIFHDPQYQQYSFQMKHQAIIRYRLMKGREQYNKINGKRLGRKSTIEKLQNLGIDISEQTFDSLFDPKCGRSHIDISAVAAICRILDLNISQILAFPDETITDAEEKEFNVYGNYWKTLDDPNYNGDFYCYFFRTAGTDTSFTQEYPNSLLKTEDLIEGQLVFDISKTHGSIAAFHFTHHMKSADDNPIDRFQTSTCIPMLSTISQNVYLRFTDNDGYVYHIVFDRQDFYSGKCYFRIAGLITESHDRGHLPIFQKMILLQNRIDKKNLNYIKGLLNFNSETIIISKDMLYSLAETDDEIRKFIDCYEKIYTSCEKQLLVFNENLIMTSDSGMSLESKKSALIKLRHHTFSQNQLYLGDDMHAHKIAKKLQKGICKKIDE